MLYFCCYKVERVKQYLKKLYRAIFCNFLIRLVLENYFELSIVYLIRMHAIDTSTWYEILGSSMTLVGLALLVSFCLLTPVFLACKSSTINSVAFIAKYGSLIESMKLSKSFLVKNYFMIFMIRRLIFASVIVFLPFRPWA